MKYLKQFTIILAVTFIGEVLYQWIPLPIPASIYGMVLLYIALLTGVIKVSSVKETGKFLIEIMPVMFIPAAAQLLESWGIIKPLFAPIVTILVVTTVLVTVVAGRVTQLVIRKDRKKEVQHE
jgi:holin-like protein